MYYMANVERSPMVKIDDERDENGNSFSRIPANQKTYLLLGVRKVLRPLGAPYIEYASISFGKAPGGDLLGFEEPVV
jgi:hypothetical protein